MNDTTFHLVYATDMGYLMPTRVSLASALAFLSDPKRLVVHVLDCGIAEGAWSEFIDYFSAKFNFSTFKRHRMSNDNFEGFMTFRNSFGTYARLFLPKILKDVPWCLYVDGDTLFLGDVLETCRLFDSDKMIQGQKDWVGYTDTSMYFSTHKLEWDPQTYVCAGVLIMNLAQFRQKSITEKCLDYLHNHPDSICPDQDALNLCCLGHVGLLPPEWGCFNHTAFMNGVAPKCVHYTLRKPWQLTGTKLHCMADLEYYWWLFALDVVGLSVCDFKGGFSLYVYRRILAWVRRCVLPFLCLTKSGEGRFGGLRRFNAPSAYSEAVKRRIAAVSIGKMYL